MKYIGLLSGGKDSCFNLLHCYYHRHELVAAASLGPPDGKEEIDSYLYQTVGQDTIELVAQALDVPLYRRTISGSAIEQGLDYGTRFGNVSGGVQGDETEDLYELLSTVKLRHPEVQGVSVGAILSNYQRIRVEHVCRRLGLTALSYLWQRDQAELMSEMINVGMDAILIKVAGIGLKQMHLGKTLAEMQPLFIRLHELYGSHICGEGGEYETLTLDCPLFKRRIKLVDVETVIHSDNAFATVAYLRIKDAVLEQKSDPRFSIPIPSLLEEDFLNIQSAIVESPRAESCVESSDAVEKSSVGRAILKRPTKLPGPWIALADICSKHESHKGELSFEQEVEECFKILQDRLAKYNLDLSHCTNINIFLSSIDLFSRLNSVYAQFFGTSPPARACVAVDLLPPARVKLDCIAYAENKTSERKALHVQGLSYWAPANIGPYSQAIRIGERVFISGQIGLIPSTLSLPSPPSLATEAALVFQHANRVANAMKGTSGEWTEGGHTHLALYWLVDETDASRIQTACETYNVEDKTPTLFIGVLDLPKGALIEKQVLLHTGRCLVHDSGDEDEEELVFQHRIPEYKQGRLQDDHQALCYEISVFNDSGDACAVICGRGNGGDGGSLLATLKAEPCISCLLPRTFSVRLFHLASAQSSAFAFCDLLFEEERYPEVTSIPSRFIRSKSFSLWDYALCIIAN